MAGKKVTAIAAAAACVSSAAWGHHSPAAYDTGREIVLVGAVTEVAWQNPHVYITIESFSPDGARVEQDVEGGPLSALRAGGFRPEAVNLGDRVRILANPNRRGEGHTVLGLTLTTAGGAVMSLRGGRGEAPFPEAVAKSIAGVWRPATADFFALAQSRPSWPFTDEGRRAFADRDAMRAAVADCSPFGTPAIMIEPLPTKIEIGEDSVVMDLVGDDTRRIIVLDGRAPPPDAAPTRLGYSAGRWEGGVLVVETTAFAADPEGLGFALPSSPAKRVVERFRLSDDGRHLLYEATVEDPVYLREPLRMSSQWDYRPDIEPTELACDPENARRFVEDD